MSNAASPDMTEETEEVDELARLRDGGDEAVAEIFDFHREKLRRMIALRIDPRVIGKVDGEDILQEAYVQAARRIRDYLDQPSVPFFVWLRQITAQILTDYHRRYMGAKMRDVRNEVSLYQGRCDGASSASLALQLADSLTSPSQFAVREEMIAELRTVLETLDDMDREVLVLRHLEELGNNEVAQILGIDKYAASKRYLRALERLRRAMPPDE